MAARFNKGSKPTWGDIANWIELLNLNQEEPSSAIIARFREARTKAEGGVKAE